MSQLRMEEKSKKLAQKGPNFELCLEPECLKVLQFCLYKISC